MSFLGKPTIADEITLVAAKDHDTTAVIDAFKSFSPTWVKKDGAAMAAWLADWGAFWKRWQSARQAANREILAAKVNLTPNDRLLSGSYNGILRAFTREQGRFQKGDFQDLYNRLVAAGARVDMGPPQPTAHDVDRDMYNVADKAAKAVEKVPVLGPLAGAAMQDLGLGRETADKPTEAEVTKSKWIVGGILAAVLAGVVAILRGGK
jgi:hypothetical protein